MTAPDPRSPASDPRDVPVVDAAEGAIARALAVGALVAVALLVVGVALLLAAGLSPLEPTFPVFDPASVVADLIALRPEGFLWAGIVVVLATPILRVVGEALGFARGGERWLAAVATAILLVIAASVAIGQAVA